MGDSESTQGLVHRFDPSDAKLILVGDQLMGRVVRLKSHGAGRG